MKKWNGPQIRKKIFSFGFRFCIQVTVKIGQKIAFKLFSSDFFKIHNKNKGITTIWRWERVAAVTVSARRKSQKWLKFVFWELLRFFGGSQNFLTNFSNLLTSNRYRRVFQVRESRPTSRGVWTKQRYSVALISRSKASSPSQNFSIFIKLNHIIT